MKILLTGATGQLGRAVLARLDSQQHQIYAPARQHCDLAQPQQVRQLIAEFKPELIINPAAYTAVDQAESEPALAHTINAEAVCEIATAARQLGATVIHYSTDYVFDGSKVDANGDYLPYQENEACAPLNCYGASKRAGEQALQASGAAHLILRTSWVYTWYGKNFLLTMLRLAQQRPELSIVADQIGAPTSADFLAQATLALLPQLKPAQDYDWWQEYRGIYHLSCAGQTSWHGFASEIFKQAEARGLIQNQPNLLAIPSSAYPTPARRPQNSLLDCHKISQQFGIQRPDWRVALSEVLDKYQDSLAKA